MKNIITIILIGFSALSFAQLGPEEDVLSLEIPLVEQVEHGGKEYEVFDVGFDWMLDVQTEVVNGIWYSPTIEFNLNAKNGLNLQFQTAALPTLKGVMIHKVQPSAGISIGYHF